MEPETITRTEPRCSHFPSLKDDHEIEQLYKSTQPENNKLFDVLLEDINQSAGAEQNTPLENQQKKKIEEPKRLRCKCSKIGCLKMYCECFSNNLNCTELCRCSCCRNKPRYQKQIKEAQMLANYKNPGTFKGVPAYIPARKCTCKKSKCQKKYCECYNAGLTCTEFCECKKCSNREKKNKRSNFQTSLNNNSEMEVQSSD